MLSPSSLSLDALEDYLKETVEDVSFHNKSKYINVNESRNKIKQKNSTHIIYLLINLFPSCE